MLVNAFDAKLLMGSLLLAFNFLMMDKIFYIISL